MENEDFINKLITKWEDDTTEFKLSLDKDEVGRTICAFANDYNNLDIGHLIIGVNPKNRLPEGIEIGNWDEIQKLLASICNSMTPPVIPQLIKIPTQTGNSLLLIKVNRSMIRPHRYKGKCFIRVFSTTRAATLEEENQLKTKSTTSFLTFDALPNTHASLDDLDDEKIIEHYRTTRVSDSLADKVINISDILKKGLGLCCEVDDFTYPTNAAILMFGKNPQSSFPNAFVNAIRFEGGDVGSRIFERREIKGTLDTILSDSINYLKKFMTTSSIIEPATLLREKRTAFYDVE